MVIIIFKSNYIIYVGCSGTIVEYRVLTNTSKLIGGICYKVVKVGVLGIHVFLNQYEVFLLSLFKCGMPTWLLLMALLLLHTYVL